MSQAARTSAVAALAGLLAVSVGCFLDTPRTLFAYLTAYVTVASVAVGALFFLAIAHTTGAGWMIVLRRRAEDMASIFPALALLFVPIAVGLHVLYPWAASPDTWTPELRARILPKIAYLNAPFFLVRASVYLASWVIIAELLRRASRAQDSSASPELVERQRILAATTLPWMGFTITFAAFDWLMSLDPAWSSNVFGIYLFSGGFGASIGLLSLLAFGPFRARVQMATPEHAHALGRILFAFVIVWTYIAFTQYLLLWLADLPDEAVWVKLRTEGRWGYVAIVLAIGHFVLPFGALLSRNLKRRPKILAAIGAWLVVAHAVDVYWLVVPQISATPRIHWVDAGALLFVAGSATLVAILRAGTEREVPAADPGLARGLRYEEVA